MRDMNADTQAKLIEHLLASSDQSEKTKWMQGAAKELAHGLYYRVRSLERSHEEWLVLSEWVQSETFDEKTSKAIGPTIGMHRMEVVNRYIEYLENRNQKLIDETHGLSAKSEDSMLKNDLHEIIRNRVATHNKLIDFYKGLGNESEMERSIVCLRELASLAAFLHLDDEIQIKVPTIRKKEGIGCLGGGPSTLKNTTQVLRELGVGEAVLSDDFLLAYGEYVEVSKTGYNLNLPTVSDKNVGAFFRPIRTEQIIWGVEPQGDAGKMVLFCGDGYRFVDNGERVKEGDEVLELKRLYQGWVKQSEHSPFTNGTKWVFNTNYVLRRKLGRVEGEEQKEPAN